MRYVSIFQKKQGVVLVNNTLSKIETSVWGWLPILAMVEASGLFMVALAFNGGRTEQPWSEVVYWIGVLVLFVPIAIRLYSPVPTRQERLGLVVGLGLGLYFIKILYSPIQFKFADELQHWRTSVDILESSHLFLYNYSLPVSSFYPGLENVTTAFQNLSGLTIFNSGIITIGMARLVFVLGLYLFYEYISRSPRIASIASLIYMANPHYMFLNSFFIYQAFALPLTAFVLFVTAKEMYGDHRHPISLKLVIILGLAAVTVTHHITSYALGIVLVIWTLVTLAMRLLKHKETTPAWIMILFLVIIMAWIKYAAPITIDYLKPPISKAAIELVNFITRDTNTGQVFRPPNGPFIERYLNMGSVGVISLCLLPSIWLTGWRYRNHALGMTMAVGSLEFYGSLLIRLGSSDGAELAGRSWSFVYLVVAFTLATGIIEFSKMVQEGRIPHTIFKPMFIRLKQYNWVIPVTSIAFIVIIFLGGITGGWPPYWARLPGPYLAAAFERSIEPKGVAVAEWASKELGPSNRVATDFTNYTLMGTYGRQDPVRGLSEVFYASDLGPDEKLQIRDASVRYLLVDYRLTKSLPISGRYFDPDEPDPYQHTKPFDIARFKKFDDRADISRIFDNGDIAIYDVGIIAIGQ